MMYRSLLTILTFLSVAAQPATAHAYLTPDDVLYEDDFSARFFDPPPSRREIQEIAEQQQENSARRREEEQAALRREMEEDDAEDMHGAAPEEPAGESSELDELREALERLQDGTAARTAEEERLLQRLADREEQDTRDAWLNSLGEESLHSGAPLTDTGPATVLVTLAVAGAIGETWRRVRKG